MAEQQHGLPALVAGSQPRKVTVAATQMACSWEIEDNLVRWLWNVWEL
jgi:hypothetical protein